MPKIKARQRVYFIAANDIALKTIGRPLGNTALLGAFAAATQEFELNTLFEAIKHRFKGKVQEANIEAVKQGYYFVKGQSP